jgi:DNA-directed RNA polymerase specialized sigma24 family protein
MPRSGTEGFEQFAADMRPRMVRALVGSCGIDDAPDAASEALLYALANWDAIRSMENPGGYLFRVGQSRSRRRREPRLPAPIDVGLPDVEPALIPALMALPTTQRTAVWLVHACDWPYREVAEAMNISESMVGNHVSRGLDALRRKLGVESHA